MGTAADVMLQRLAAGLSRRSALRGLGGGLLAGLTGTLLAVGLPGRGGADIAAKKRKNKKRKHKKRKNGQNNASPPPPPPPPPPLLPPGLGRCDQVDEASLTGARRFAQTFVPPRSGLLTAAEVFLARNGEGFDLNFQIRDVDADGVPGDTILANTTVEGIAATGLTDRPRSVVAPFAEPAVVELGVRYALVLTDGQGSGFAIRYNSPGNPCPDGELFGDSAADGNFKLVGLGNADLVYALTIAS